MLILAHTSRPTNLPLADTIPDAHVYVTAWNLESSDVACKEFRLLSQCFGEAMVTKYSYGAAFRSLAAPASYSDLWTKSHPIIFLPTLRSTVSLQVPSNQVMERSATSAVQNG